MSTVRDSNFHSYCTLEGSIVHLILIGSFFSHCWNCFMLSNVAVLEWSLPMKSTTKQTTALTSSWLLLVQRRPSQWPSAPPRWVLLCPGPQVTLLVPLLVCANPCAQYGTWDLQDLPPPLLLVLLLTYTSSEKPCCWLDTSLRGQMWVLYILTEGDIVCVYLVTCLTISLGWPLWRPRGFSFKLLTTVYVSVIICLSLSRFLELKTSNNTKIGRKKKLWMK